MNTKITIALLGGAALLAASLSAAPALAGPDDINPVFAALPEMPAAELDGTSGRGAVTQGSTVSGTLMINPICTATCSSDTGNNIIDGSVFAGSSVFAAVVQNTGSFVSVQNLLVVEVEMIH